jgi:hypothetical protein
MARLIFPNAEDRLVYGPGSNNSPLLSKAGIGVTIYTDAAGTVLANILDLLGAVIIGSRLVVDSNSLLPLFQGPDALDTLYAKADNSPTVAAIYARTDDRIDAEVAARVAADAAALTAANGTYEAGRTTTLFVSPAGLDTNNGKTSSTSKLTVAAAYAALPASGGRIVTCWGSVALPSNAIGFQILPGKPCILDGDGRQGALLTYAGSGIGIQVGDGRSVTDGVLNSTTTVTSATAAFTAADTGKVVFGDGVPGGATATYVNATTVTLSSAATVTASGVTLQIATDFQDWGSLSRLQLSCTGTATTGVKLTQAHRGFMDDIRLLGNSYQAGSRGVWNINSYTNYINRPVIESFDTGIDLDGVCNDVSIDNANIGAKTACARVKNSTDVRLRGGQYSTTGIAAGGSGVVVVSTNAVSTDGNCEGLLIDQIHFEGNQIGQDVCIGRVADGSTTKVRSPIINAKLVNGGTIDRATRPLLLNTILGFSATLTLTANCSDARLVGDISNNGTLTDSGVRTTRDVDLLTLRNGSRVTLDVMAYTFGQSAGNWDTITQDSTCFYGGHRSNTTSNTLNDRMTMIAYLPAGTYAADVFYKKDTDGGQVQVVLDGVAAPGVVECYAAAPAAAFTTMQPMAITGSGMKTFSLQVTAKNASSTGYKARVSQIVLRRTA